MNEAPISTTTPTLDPIDAAIASLDAATNPKPDPIDAEIKKLEAKDIEATPESSEATTADEAKADRYFKAAAQAQRAERKAKEAQRQLEALQRQTDEKIKAAQSEAESTKALLKNLRSKDGLEAVLKAAGVDFNDIAQAYLGLDPSSSKPSAEQKVEALERRLAEREAAEAKARSEWEQSQDERRKQQAYQSDLKVVQDFITSKADDFELVASDPRGIQEVVSRVSKFIADKADELPQQLSVEDTNALITHFATAVENEAIERAKANAQTLSKFKKLQALGIFTHSTNEPSDSLEPKPLDAHQSLIDELTDTKSAKPSTKFLTDELIAAPPIAAKKQYMNTGDKLVDEVIEQFNRANRSQRTA